MYSRRIACFLLGMWLAVGLFVFWMNVDSNRAGARAVEEPNANVALGVKALGRQPALQLLQHAAAEQQRHTVAIWESVQLAGGAAFFAFLLFGTREGKWPLGLALLLLAIVAAERFVLTPEVTGLGRVTDFGVAAHGGYRVRLLVVHSAGQLIEVAKWGLQVVLLAILTATRNRVSGHPGKSFDAVDQRDYGHVNR